MNNKLEKIKETSKYYKTLLKIFSTNPSENYSLTEEEKILFKDDELFNRFIADLAGMIILIQTENRADEDPDERTFNKIFRIKSTTVDSIKEKMKQIRNCFAHSETTKSEEVIEFDNGKINGEVFINQLIFLPNIYNKNDTQDLIKAFEKVTGKQIDIEELFHNPKLYIEFFEKVSSGGTRILAGGIIGEQINNENDIERLFKMGKVVKFSDKKLGNNAITYMYSSAILRLIDWKNMSPTQLTKIIRAQIPENTNFQVKSLREYSDLIKSYIDYVGGDVFYNLDFSLQREIIANLVDIKEHDEKDKIPQLTSLYPPITEIKKLAEQGISEVNLNCKTSKQLSSLICNSYSSPFMYENVMYAYIYNRLIYLKEMLNTNQIDESILNYSNIDISDINYKYTFSKKDIQKRKQEIDKALLNISKSVEALKTKKVELENKMQKSDNSRNPKREKMVEEYISKINNVKTLIMQEENRIRKLEEEKRYINKNNKIPVTPNMIFRTLRNSATHGFGVGLYSRVRALRSKNLGELTFKFEDREDKGAKAEINITAARLVKLITDIENGIISNINRINGLYNPLEDAVEETKKNTRVGEINGIISKIAKEKEDKNKPEKDIESLGDTENL